MFFKATLFFCVVLIALSSARAQEPLRILPMPSEIQPGEGLLAIDSSFRISLSGYHDALLQNAAIRLATNLHAKTGLMLALQPLTGGKSATLRIHCDAADPHFLTPEADESYTLEVTSHGAELHAHGPTGVLRGMATFFQLVRMDAQGFRAPAMKIIDRPRFAWRGLMLDVARHFLTAETIKRNLDAMELVKMNVLELHLSDAEGFRVESKVFPKLQQLGSNGEYYTQEEVRDLVAYARDRGIRVIPEIEMPGHARAMLVAYPEIAAMPGPYALGGDSNSMSATIDPTREETYQFLARLLSEMASLFPDPYFQAGGDEVNGTQWAENSSIQAFMKDHGFKNKHDLQGYFTERVRQILAKDGKTMVGWDEVLQPNLSKDVVIQAWRSSKLVQRSAAQGHITLVSAGYYLDHNLPAATHYAIDPLDTHAEGLPPGSIDMVKGTPLAPYVTQDNVAVDSLPLTPGQEKLVAGGIACMWSEFVWNEKEEMMVWPRAAAIAERLWSPAAVNDVASLYRRLQSVDADLQLLGLRHHVSEALMLQQLAGDHNSEPLQTLAETVEPLKNLARFAPRLHAAMTAGKAIDNTIVTTRFVDALPAESMAAHDFRETARQMLAGGNNAEKLRQQVRAKLTTWRDNDSKFQAIAQDSFLLKEAIPASQDLRELAETGLEALTILESGKPASAVWLDQRRALLAKHRKVAEGGANLLAAMLSPQPAHELMNVIAPAIEDLVNAAAAVH